MGLPNIEIKFKTQAASAISRSQKGAVSIIIRDGSNNGHHVLTGTHQIPSDLSVENKNYIARTFIGYINPPRKVILYVLPEDGIITDALSFLETQLYDYLVGPPDVDTEECNHIANFVKKQRQDGNTPKAVLPNTASDTEAVVNFTTTKIKVGNIEYDTAQYCSRIAGLIAGTPMTISCTNAVLPEVIDVERLNKEEADVAIDEGQFILFHDGEKVKVGRGVNSLVTTTQEKGEQFKKIKIVEAIDMIKSDIKKTAQDNYIGKYSNSYDNKCLLISAIKGYFISLELDGILERYTSAVEFDLGALESYLLDRGVNTESMDEMQIKTATTGDEVFLTARISILDAIEEIKLNITV